MRELIQMHDLRGEPIVIHSNEAASCTRHLRSTGSGHNVAVAYKVSCPPTARALYVWHIEQPLGAG